MINRILKNTAQKISLRTTIIVPFVIQIAVVAGLVSYLSLKNSQQAIEDLTSQLSSKVTDQINEHLEHYLEKPHLLQGVIASAFRNGNLKPDNFTALERQFWSDIRLSDSVDYIYIGKENGEFLGVQRYLDGQIVVKFRTNKTAPKRLVYELPSYGDRHKLLQSKEYDPRNRPWYNITVEAGTQTWSPIFTSANLGMLQISSTTPIYDPQGKLIGVLASNLLLAQINEFLNNLDISPSGEAFIIERSGDLVASSTAEKPSVEAAEAEDPLRLSAIASKQPVIQVTTQQLLERVQDLKQIQEPFRFRYQLDNQDLWVQVTPLQSQDELDWLIAVVIPQNDFMAPIHASKHRTIWLCVAALVIAIVIGILTAGWVTRPISKITAASKAMSKGNLDQQVDEDSPVIELGTLAHSFNSMAEQLQESFATLEDKVQARTTELAQANQKISSLNEQLKAENLRMGAELDVARHIQQMILPKIEELESIKDLDIAAYMKPADEVGGDYYDVLQTDGIVTLGIGDVTGHGLESGLLMLMTQTAVRTLKEIKERDPVRFLDTLNRTIYRNVQRMNSDKNLTLSILNYSESRVSISGQHEEALIVRLGGQIERIDTIDLGLPIGIDDNITDFISHITVELNSGDGVVLYTDGIPEAFNLRKKQYGMERFCQVISQNWQLTAQDLTQAVIDDVREFIGKQKVFDDITLVILKKQ